MAKDALSGWRYGQNARWKLRSSKVETEGLTAFDWDRYSLHLQAIHEYAKSVPWVLLDPGGSRGDLFHDPFGRTIHASDMELGVGKVHHIGEAGMDWHAEPVQILARILRKCTRTDAKRLAGRKLATRAHYYEVLID